jgi:hypothetical protein
MRDIHNNIKVLNAKTGLLSNDVAQTITFDRAGYLALELFILTGVLGDAAATFVRLVEDSDDNSVFAAVADDFLLGLEVVAADAFDQADDNKVYKIGYVGVKRYVRLTITPTGNADASPFALLAIGGTPLVAPIAAQVTTNV